MPQGGYPAASGTGEMMGNKNLMKQFEAQQRRFKALAPKANHGKRMAFVQKLAVLDAEAISLGLVVTGHALNDAKRAAGWEVAGDLTKASEYVSGIV